MRQPDHEYEERSFGDIQMKRNQNFDHNHSQKVFSCRYNHTTM